ncbi:MAG: HdeD family acid-resistance protein [Bacteroidales bacterium]|jgi:uncharacterized membrane protein HdeD (DUF308 family)
MKIRRIDISLVSCIISLVLGLVMVIWPELVADYLVFALGLLFLIPGAISIISYFVNKRRNVSIGLPIRLSGLGSVLFGLLLMLVPSFFANMIVFILGMAIAMGGLFQIVQLYHAREWVKVSAFAYVVPILLFILGIYSILNPSDAKEKTFLVIGVGILVYAVSGLFNWLFFSRKRPPNTNVFGVKIEDAEIVEDEE